MSWSKPDRCARTVILKKLEKFEKMPNKIFFVEKKLLYFLFLV